MGYELLTIPDCPNGAAALALFREALPAEGKAGGHVSVREVTSDSEAEELQFHGSPSFLAGGHDLFPSESAPALCCRVYASAHGLAGLPSLEALRNAVRAVPGG